MAHQFLHSIFLHCKLKQREIQGVEEEVKLFKHFLKISSLSLCVSELVIIVKNKQTQSLWVIYLI